MKRTVFPAHYSEADQMVRFSSAGGCRHSNNKDKVALFVMHIMILHILCPGDRRPRWHHPGAVSSVSPSPESSYSIPLRRYLLLEAPCLASPTCVQDMWAMSGKAASFRVTHEDYKESSGQGHKGSSDHLQSFEKQTRRAKRKVVEVLRKKPLLPLKL